MLDRAARWAARRVSWRARWAGTLVDADDIRQEAIAEGLEAIRRGWVSPGSPSLRLLAIQKGSALAARTVAPTSGSDGRAGRPIGHRARPREALDGGASCEVDVLALVRLARLTAARELAEAAAVRPLPGYVREMGARAAAGRYQGLHAELAERLKVSRHTVARALGRYARTIAADETCLAIDREIEQLRKDMTE